MAQKSDNGYLTLRKSCRPCVQGYHNSCRHHPDKDGSYWVTDDDGTRRLAFFEGGIYNEKGRGREIPRPPCQCEADNHRGNPGTCGMWMSADWGDGARCGKMPIRATKKVQVGLGGYGDEREIEVELCGLHNGVQKRLEANAAKRREENRIRNEKRERIKNATHASMDWAEKLREEFGLPVEGMAAGRDEMIRVEMSPEEAYKILDGVRSMLDEVYEEHPFRRAREW